MSIGEKPISANDTQAMHLALLARQVKALETIAEHLGVMALASAPKAPNWRRPIAEYVKYDWAAIGARVLAEDSYGATSVEWSSFIWTRRSPKNKFAEAIWFSRATGEKDDQGNVRYARLITFSAPSEAEALPRGLAAEVEQRRPTLQQDAAQVQTPATVTAGLEAVGITGSQPTRFPPAPQPGAVTGNPRATKYDPTKDGRILALAQSHKDPSAVLGLADIVVDSTLFYVTARLWKIDTTIAKDIWHEHASNPPAAWAALDQNVF